MAKLKTIKGEKIGLPDRVRPKRELPRFTLVASDLKEIKNWIVGKRYNLAVEIEVVGLSKGEWDFENPEMKAVLKITKVKAGKNPDKILKHRRYT